MDKLWYTPYEDNYTEGSFSLKDATRMAIRSEIPTLKVYYADCDEDGKIIKELTYKREMKIEKPFSLMIRELSGIKTRVAFAKEYKIPVRTIEDWDAGIYSAPEYVTDLLARAVIVDKGLFPVFYVFTIKGNEWLELKTKNITDAVKRARREVEDNKETRQDYKVEIRVFVSDYEDENAENLDYETVKFQF